MEEFLDIVNNNIFIYQQLEEKFDSIINSGKIKSMRFMKYGCDDDYDDWINYLNTIDKLYGDTAIDVSFKGDRCTITSIQYINNIMNVEFYYGHKVYHIEINISKIVRIDKLKYIFNYEEVR